MNKKDELQKKLFSNGVASFSDIELISTIVGDPQAAYAVSGFVGGSYKKLAMLYPGEIANIPGLTKLKAAKLIAAMELGRRKICEELKPARIINNSFDIATYIREKIGDSPVEIFSVLLLSRSNRIMHEERIGIGGYTGVVADPRIIIKLALDHKAVSMILYHNHPSGNLQPSSADKEITLKVKTAAKYFDISLLDHIIVSQTGYYSFADEGIL